MSQRVNGDSTDTIAMIIEGIFGIFGFLGVGWMYAGSIGRGLLMMVGMWVFIAIESVVGTLTGGLAMCLFAPVHLIILVFSAIKVRNHVRETGAQGSASVVIMGIIGLVVCCVIGVIIFFFFSTALTGFYQNFLMNMNY